MLYFSIKDATTDKQMELISSKSLQKAILLCPRPIVYLPAATPSYFSTGIKQHARHATRETYPNPLGLRTWRESTHPRPKCQRWGDSESPWDLPWRRDNARPCCCCCCCCRCCCCCSTSGFVHDRKARGWDTGGESETIEVSKGERERARD